MTLADCPAIIDNAAQNLEQTRQALNFVDDDELARLLSQIGIGIVKPPQVSRSLEIEIQRGRWPVGGDLSGQGGLADLARPQQSHRRRFAKASTQGVL